MNTRPIYPPARPRVGAPAPQLAEVYGRVESTQVEVTLGDTDADVFLFSGTPALIRLTARTNGALFTLTDRTGRETHEIAVLANQHADVRLPRDRVVGRNLVGGANAAVFAEGFYAAEAEAIHTAPKSPPGAEPEAVATPDEGGLPCAGHMADRGSSPRSSGFRYAG